MTIPGNGERYVHRSAWPHDGQSRSVSGEQLGFFGGASADAWPEGFRYQADVISPREEETLLHEVRRLPFREFEFHGYRGKRRVISFGWRYSFNDRKLQKVDELPEFLKPLRATAALFSGHQAEEFAHALVTEYDVGAPIGWHRDKAVFGDVVGVSLLAACTFRLRRKVGEKWERVSIIAEPRSAYLMSGASRTEWEHSIPPVDHLRYSVTFRTLK